MKNRRSGKLAVRRREPSPTVGRGWPTSPFLVGSVVLLLVTLICYLPALRAGFIWDDAAFVITNPFVKLPLGLYYIWFSTALPDYYPVTLTSFWLEWRLWGMNATGYHLTNVLLHGTSACLLWQVLKALRIPGAWLAALVFAVHPVNVQSVAWIAERKNTLCMFFSLLSVFWYLRFDSESHLTNHTSLSSLPSSILQRPSSLYYLSLLAFLCALLSKTAVVMLPCVLLLCHWWRRTERPGPESSVESRGPEPRAGAAAALNTRLSTLDPRLLWRLAPFFALSLVLGLVTMWFQRHRAIGGETIRADDLLTRLAGAGRAVWFYAGQTLAPLDLCFVYPQWQIDKHAIASWLPLAGGMLVFVILWAFRHRGTRTLLFASLCFVLMLVPVLGLVDVYFHGSSLVADHYAYFAGPALIALCVGAGSSVFRRLRSPGKWCLPVAAVALVGWLGVATWRQTHIYENINTLWEDTLAKNPACWLAHNSLGSVLTDVGRLDEGRIHFEQGLAIKPDSAELLNNLASVLLDQHKPEEAIPHLQKALVADPRSAMACYNLGNAFDQLNQSREAETQYRRAIQLDPAHAESHGNLGCLLYAAGKRQEAMEEFTRAISLKPGYPEALNNLGVIFLELRRFQEAESLLLEAVRARPAYPDAHFNLGNAVLSQGRPDDAAAAYRHALALVPQHPLARCRLGVALWQKGAAQFALAELEGALRLRPDLAEAHYQMGCILAAQQQPAGALTRFREALRLQPDWPEALAGLAFTLATTSSDSVLDPAEALRVATRAVELTHNTNAIALDSFAAACAATGNFDKATRTATRAAELALAAGDTKRAEEFQSRRSLYAAGKPYRY